MPAGAGKQDLGNRFVAPGLINAHGHVGETRGLKSAAELYTRENVLAQLRLYARYGVTTVFSLGADQPAGVAVRDEESKGPIDRARLFVAGPVIVGATPEEARKQVDEVVAMGADIVKVRVDDNLGAAKKIAPEVYTALIDQAHKRSKKVAVHIYYLDDAKGVLKAGADFIAHSIRDRDVDDELISLLKARNVCVCPTLAREVSTFVYESEPAFFTDPSFLRAADPTVVAELKTPERQRAVRESKSAQHYKKSLEQASQNLKTLEDFRGIRIAMGTDTGPPARFQGYFEHMELELMAKAGLTPQQVFAAATTDAATCLWQAKRLGVLEPGAWGDFVVLSHSPLESVAAWRTIESVWVGGSRVPDQP